MAWVEDLSEVHRCGIVAVWVAGPVEPIVAGAAAFLAKLVVAVV